MRRIRGILVSMMIWAVPWALVGLAFGFVLTDMGFAVLRGGPSRLDILGFLTLFGAVIGAVNGLLFAILVLAAERKRTIETLHVGRIGLWGALATGVIGALLGRIMIGLPIVGLGIAALGFGAAASMAYLARRGAGADDARSLTPGT